MVELTVGAVRFLVLAIRFGLFQIDVVRVMLVEVGRVGEETLPLTVRTFC